MDFVILDLEWNPSYSKKLKGFINEIIELGAIRINSSMELTETFSILIKPQVGKKLNEKITTLTHITNEEILEGCTYTHALSKFKRFLGDSTLMTWGITDIHVLMENSRYYLQDDKLFFINKYVDIQQYCDDMICKNTNSTEQAAPRKQLGLMTAVELLNIDAESISHHRALDDSILSYECFKRLYSYPLLLPYINNFDNNFYKKLTFKNAILCDLENPLINKSEMYFTCPCGYRAKRKTQWKFSSKAFTALFICRGCGNKFIGRIQFKLKYDGVHVIKKIIIPTSKQDTNKKTESIV